MPQGSFAIGRYLLVLLLGGLPTLLVFVPEGNSLQEDDSGGKDSIALGGLATQGSVQSSPDWLGVLSEELLASLSAEEFDATFAFDEEEPLGLQTTSGSVEGGGGVSALSGPGGFGIPTNLDLLCYLCEMQAKSGNPSAYCEWLLSSGLCGEDPPPGGPKKPKVGVSAGTTAGTPGSGDCVGKKKVFLQPVYIDQDNPANQGWILHGGGYPPLFGGSEPSTSDNYRISLNIIADSPVTNITWFNQSSSDVANLINPPPLGPAASTWDLGEIPPSDQGGYIDYMVEVDFADGC